LFKTLRGIKLVAYLSLDPMSRAQCTALAKAALHFVGHLSSYERNKSTVIIIAITTIITYTTHRV